MAENTVDYYNETASQYDRDHGHHPEHDSAVIESLNYFDHQKISSVLDLGCGTGRVLGIVSERLPDCKLTGVDPSESLMEVAKQKLPDADFVVGAGESLSFPDNSFDVVFATGIMHHVDNPEKVIREMYRISRYGVVISDHNNFAFGRPLVRKIRLVLYALNLLGLACYIKQGFRKQGYSDNDGWWYPYSLFNNYGLISELSEKLLILPTRKVNTDEQRNLLICQSHIAIIGWKKTSE